MPILWILCMLPPGHCCCGNQMMLCLALCSFSCKPEVCACIWNNFLGESKCLWIWFWLLKPGYCLPDCLPFHNRALSVVIYNAQKWFIFDKKDISANCLSWSVWNLIWHWLLLLLCLLIFQACTTPIYGICDVSIHVHPIPQLSS